MRGMRQISTCRFWPSPQIPPAVDKPTFDVPLSSRPSPVVPSLEPVPIESSDVETEEEDDDEVDDDEDWPPPEPLPVDD
jgi:hypothetical protein